MGGWASLPENSCLLSRPTNSRGLSHHQLYHPEVPKQLLPCRPTRLRSTRRIEEAVARRLVEKFSDQSETPDSRSTGPFSEARSDRRSSLGAVEANGSTVEVTVSDANHELTRDEARQLRDRLSEALTRRREFVHTAAEHREDGAYVVERRGASSSGHRKVFDSFDAAREAFERLPAEFTAEDVATAGVSGGRRHMLVWHFAESPAFDCRLVSRQPLTVEKADSRDTQGTSPQEVGAD